MKGNPLEGGYKGFFMEESLRKAEETSSSSRSIDQLKKGVRRGAGGDRKAPCETAPLYPKGLRRFPKGDRKALGNKQKQPTSSE